MGAREERKHRLEMLSRELKEMLTFGEVDIRFMEGRAMWVFGISRRDAREELKAIVDFLELECDNKGIIKPPTTKEERQKSNELKED
jgi:hypothetical protein